MKPRFDFVTKQDMLGVLQRLGREAENKRRKAEKNMADIEGRISYEANPGLSLAEHGALMDSLCANECAANNMTAAMGAYARAAVELGACSYDEFLRMVGAMTRKEYDAYNRINDELNREVK